VSAFKKKKKKEKANVFKDRESEAPLVENGEHNCKTDTYLPMNVYLTFQITCLLNIDNVTLQ